MNSSFKKNVNFTNLISANIAFPLEDNGVFDEIIFTELQREEAQAQLEAYNKVGRGWG